MNFHQTWTGILDELREDSEFTLEDLDRLDAEAERVAPADLAAAAGAIETRLPERGLHRRLHYLLGRLRFREGDREAAAAAIERVLERMNQDGDHRLLAEVARRNADWLPGDHLLPLVVRAARQDSAAVPDPALAEWLALYPEEPRLHWLLGLRGLSADPPAPDHAQHLARSLVHLVHEPDTALLEEAAVPVIAALDDETAPDLLALLTALNEHRRFTEAREYLELAFESLAARGQAQPLWEILRKALTHDPQAAPLRSFAVASLTAAAGKQPEHATVIHDAGLADPAVPFAAALTRYARLMEFPPGSYVEHGSWGVGQILAHDGESLTVRFLSRPEHVFKRTLADRALDRREPGDLRVLLAFLPDRLTELRERDPAGLVAAALHNLGGSAKPRDLKRVLLPAAVPAEEWTGFWKRARAAMEEDERIDLSQSFRDLIQLAASGVGGEVPLPNMEERGDIVRQLKVLRRFLDQHPESRARAGRAHGRRLERWFESRVLTSEARILILVLISAWDSNGRSRLRDELASAARQGFSLGEFAAEEDQRMFLEIGLEGEEWASVAIAALDSKHLAIREAARAAIRDRLGEGAAILYRQVLGESPARGDAVIEVVRGAIDGSEPGFAAVPAVDIFLGLMKLLSEPQRETLRKHAQDFLVSGGPLMERLRAEPADGPVAETVAIALLNFHSSDRFLFPVIEALERIWGPSVAETLKRRRERESKKIAARLDDDTGELPVGLMTKASFLALRAEVEHIDLELRTTIPRAIQKARELGDLRENGEFESAKLKQRQFGSRLAQLQRIITDAQVIEDMPMDESRVQAGTEVSLVPLDGGAPVTFWVLGDGDSHHGPDVISYRADLGRALWRKRIGDEVELPLATGRRRLKVERIARRLPAAPSDAVR
jgi:transcription elongation factor GreA